MQWFRRLIVPKGLFVGVLVSAAVGGLLGLIGHGRPEGGDGSDAGLFV